MSFGSEIAEWASTVQQEIYEESAQATRQLFHYVINLSPKKTGRFLANWQIGNSIPYYSISSTSTYEAKNADVESIINNDFFLFNKSAYIINNVDYAKQVEEDGWRLTQPYAPVAKAISNMLS